MYIRLEQYIELYIDGMNSKRGISCYSVNS